MFSSLAKSSAYTINPSRKYHAGPKQGGTGTSLFGEKKVLLDKMKLTIGQGGGRSLVPCLPGRSLENRYLEPFFPADMTSVMFAAGCLYGFHTWLIPVQQGTEKEWRVGGIG